MGAPAQTASNFYTFAVKCNRCGELIKGRVNLSNDLSLEEQDGEVYHVRKVLVGSGHCFQRIEVELKFDAQHNLLERHIEGGEFVE